MGESLIMSVVVVMMLAQLVVACECLREDVCCTGVGGREMPAASVMSNNICKHT